MASPNPIPRSLLELGDRVVDLDRLEVVTASGAEPLTVLEAGLLRHLDAAEGRVVARAELLREVWGYASEVKSRAVDHTVRRLRRKLEPEPGTPQFLRSAYGGGYQLVGARSAAGDLVGPRWVRP